MIVTFDERMASALKIYLDVCCYNRPFDDLSQDRVYLEAEAVLSIIKRCKSSEWILVSSAIIDIELSKQKDLDKLKKAQNICNAAQEHFPLTAEAVERAEFFQQNGIKQFDSFHLAVAETNKADVFLTTDDRFVKAANRLDLGIKVSNPLLWLIEEEKK
jgi:predicted nucleic acid-binding protein